MGCPVVHFEIVGKIRDIEVIAEGRGVRIKRFCANDMVADAGGS